MAHVPRIENPEDIALALEFLLEAQESLLAAGRAFHNWRRYQRELDRNEIDREWLHAEGRVSTAMLCILSAFDMSAEELQERPAADLAERVVCAYFPSQGGEVAGLVEAA